MRIFIALLFTLNFVTAQKVVEKSLVDSTISSFQIDAANCFKIAIETATTDEVIVEATIDGEYRKDLVLNVKEEGSTVLIGAGFQPNFKNPNDKLSAHKVVSIALEIKLPAFNNVHVFGTSCNIDVKGAFEKLKITLNDGASNLTMVQGNVEVATQSGDIKIEADAATIQANSKYGKVTENEIPHGNSNYLINSVTGNILLKRIE